MFLDSSGAALFMALTDSAGFFTEFCGWGGRGVRKRWDGNTRSNSLRTLWKNARAYQSSGLAFWQIHAQAGLRMGFSKTPAPFAARMPS